MLFVDDIVLIVESRKENNPKHGFWRHTLRSKIFASTGVRHKIYALQFLVRQEENDLDVKIEVIVP